MSPSDSERLDVLEKRFAEVVALVQRIEHNTNSISAFMNDGAAAFRFFDRVWPAIRLVAKALLIVTGTVLLGYAVTHDGHFPGWFVRAWEVVK